MYHFGALAMAIMTVLPLRVAGEVTTAFIPHTQQITFGNVVSSTSSSCCLMQADRRQSQKGLGRKDVTRLMAEIRPKQDKAEELRFGWDGTQARGGAVEDAAPHRMLDEIRESGETLAEACELFNANLEMNDSDDLLMFEDVIGVIDEHYEYGLIKFKNGDMVNEAGENEGSAKILSYAALSGMSKEMTLKLWGQYYREVLANSDGTDHLNIRNFMNYGWNGVPFENGIALTKKNVGDSEWDAFSESWIP